jgi:hypothetical protein
VGSQLSCHRSVVATELVESSADVRVSSGDQAGDLHDEYHESLNTTLRKVTKNRLLFPNDEAVFKLMYLALRNISRRWTMPSKNWSGAMNQFTILFEGRVPLGGLNANSLTRNANKSLFEN